MYETFNDCNMDRDWTSTSHHSAAGGLVKYNGCARRVVQNTVYLVDYMPGCLHTYLITCPVGHMPGCLHAQLITYVFDYIPG